MTVIHLVRHGQASFGKANYDRLSDVGVRQMQVLAKYLASGRQHFDAVYTGAMERHIKSAEPLHKAYSAVSLSIGLPVVSHTFDEFDVAEVWTGQIAQMIKKDPELARDVSLGTKDPEAAERVFEKALDCWENGLIDSKVIARWRAFTHRVRQGIETIMDSNASIEHLAVFTSAGPIAAAIQMALEISDVKTMEVAWHTNNASVTRFYWNGARLSLMGFNDVSHLLAENDKSLLTVR